MDESCKVCVYAFASGYSETHQCRRRAPVAEKVPHYEDVREWVPRFPIVMSSDWCGEFERAN